MRAALFIAALAVSVDINNCMRGASTAIIPYVALTGCLAICSSIVENCLRVLSHDLRSADTCTALRKIAKCIFTEHGLMTDDLTEEEVQVMQKSIDDNRRKAGIRCSVDIRSILQEISDDRKRRLTESTRRPTGIIYSETYEDCASTMRKYSAGISCEVYTPFLKCALRTVKVLRVVKDYRILEKSVRDEMTKEGINCSVDVRELMREIERERGQTYTPARTVFRDTGAVYTTTQRLPGKVASKPGVFNRFPGYTYYLGAEKCIKFYENLRTQESELSCDNIALFFKCEIYFKGLYKTNARYEDFKFFQFQHDIIMDLVGLRCKYDFRDLLDEVQKEQVHNKTAKTYESMILLYLMSMLSIFVMFPLKYLM